jgi:hypothetical protein
MRASCPIQKPLPIRQLSPEVLVEKLRTKDLTFRSLHKPERLAIVAALSADHTQGEIAKLLGCSRDTVNSDMRRIRAQSVQLVESLTVETQAGELIRVGRWLAQKAAAKGDYAGSWRILKELNEQLQSMGFVKRAPLEFQGKMTFVDLLASAGIATTPQELTDVARRTTN